MSLHLYNTASGEIEEFKSREVGSVKMYHCGPTVYNYAHIGNLRPYIIWDVLRRVLEWEKYDVTQVINITDVGHLSSDADEGEDKMTKGLVRENLEISLEGMKKLGEKYMRSFTDDLIALNIEIPHHLPRASDYITEDIAVIRLLEERGFVYKTSDGLYFDTSKDSQYGKKLKGGAVASADHSRVAQNPEKKNSRDFALWKFNTHLGWESPWGRGFPGWHIECSAMSSALLGASFDIHTGGIDHIPVHHTNEIAQSENAFDVPLATVWLHSNFLNIKNEKISKSLSNEILLSDIRAHGFSPLAYRYFVLGAHYRSEQNFTWEALEASSTALNKLSFFVDDLHDHATPGEANEALRSQFEEALFDDLNTPQALALAWGVVRSDSLDEATKLGTLLAFDRVLGLKLGSRELEIIPEDIERLAREREEARARQEWEEADRIRKHIEELGFTVDDTENGPRIRSRRTI